MNKNKNKIQIKNKTINQKQKEGEGAVKWGWVELEWSDWRRGVRVVKDRGAVGCEGRRREGRGVMVGIGEVVMGGDDRPAIVEERRCSGLNGGVEFE